MDILSFAFLEDTLVELAERDSELGWNSRFDECVTVIRACIHLLADAPANPDYWNKIHEALAELDGIAKENGESTLAARLKLLLGGCDMRKSSMFFRVRAPIERHSASHLP